MPVCSLRRRCIGPTYTHTNYTARGSTEFIGSPKTRTKSHLESASTSPAGLSLCGVCLARIARPRRLRLGVEPETNESLCDVRGSVWKLVVFIKRNRRITLNVRFSESLFRFSWISKVCDHSFMYLLELLNYCLKRHLVVSRECSIWFWRYSKDNSRGTFSKK